MSFAEPRIPNIGRLLLVIGTACGVALVLLAPWARDQGLATAPWIYAVFDQVCHQQPERSFHLFGQPLAVCHRCLGLYLGFLVGLLPLPQLDRLRRLITRRPRVVALFLIPMFVDVVVPANTAVTRFSTGLLAALPAAVLATIALAQIFASSSAAFVRERDEPSPSQ